MAFCFRRKESVPKAVRRLARERIESAVEFLKDCGRAGAVHCTRKEIKKVRAVMRLVRAKVTKRAYRRQNRLLKKAARQLAGPRDAWVKIETLRNLTHHFKSRLTPGALRRVRPELRNAFEQEMKRFAKENRARDARRVLRGAAKELQRLDVSGKGWKALGPGIRTAYRQGRCAYQTARKDPSPENFHQWRKRAKELWYQVSLLRPIWPEQMEAMIRELERLGDYLGDDHDLVILRQSLEEQHGDAGRSRELEILHGLIDERQRELRAAVLRLGRRFYGGKPSVFCERLARYWRSWRHEKNPSARSVDAAP
jgi:CHAD domain-containing protein